MSLEERFEAVMKYCEFLRAQKEEKEALMNFIPNTSLAKHKIQSTKIRNVMSTRKLRKLKYEFDSLDLKTKQMRVAIQQFEVDLRQFGADLYSMREIVGQPFATNELRNDHGDEVNFDLPPKFDEYEELEEEKDQEDIVEEVVDDDQSACESFIIMDSPQELELEEGGPSLFSNGARHENQELDWTLPLKFDEQEDDKLQVSELQPCNVVEELEPPSPQKECPNSQQELRTILFKERGNDVYSLGVHFHLFNSTPWELSSLRTHTWKYSIWTLWFEFHDKRHVMEFYLAKTKLKQSNSALGTSPGIKPVFVHFLVQDPLD